MVIFFIPCKLGRVDNDTHLCGVSNSEAVFILTLQGLEEVCGAMTSLDATTEASLRAQAALNIEPLPNVPSAVTNKVCFAYGWLGDVG